MSDTKNNLPRGWVLAPLGEIVHVNPRWMQHEPTDGESVSFLRMAAVEAGTGRLDPSASRIWKEVKKGYTRFQEGDVLFAKITPCMENGKAALAVGLLGGRGAGSTEFHVLRPIDEVRPKFVLHFLLQEAIRREARMKMKGAAGQLRVPPEFLEGMNVPLPPAREQRRIVEEIEKQFTKQEAGISALKRVLSNLKRYRAAVLKAAVEGRLVPTEAELARREGRSYDPASELLARIVTQPLLAVKKKAQAGVPVPPKPRHKEHVAPDAASLSKLPEGWAPTSLSQLKEFSLYGPRFSSDDYSDSGQIVVRTSDISPGGKVNVSTAPKLRLDSDEFNKYKVQVGDLLITRTGSLGTLAVFNDEVDAIPGAYLIQYRLVTPLVTNWFVFYFLKSPMGQRHLIRGGAGVGRPNLNAPTIDELPIDLPPLAEQRRIVAEVERRLSVIDELEMQVDASLKRAERLRQAILTRAFEGKLVPQDPNDEPASMLLERIKAASVGDTATPGCAGASGIATLGRAGKRSKSKKAQAGVAVSLK
jgi:type I restriction enzyme S subunit